MSLAGIAAAEPASALLGSVETRTSALPEVQTGNGEWTYEVVRGWDRCPRARFGLLGWFFSDAYGIF
jgi:hypothetical protein